jgi:hypothetical protein
MRLVFVRSCLILTAVISFLFLFPVTDNAEVHVNIGIGLPLPVYTFPAPPSVVVVPDTNVYYVPGAAVEILFYRGYWYRPYRGHWYRAAFYNGPWAGIAAARVPRTLVSVYPTYREIAPYHRPIPYGQLKKNWRHWDRERYWDRHAGEERHWHEGEWKGPERRGHY